MKKSTWKAIIKERVKKEEIQQKTTTMKKFRYLRGTWTHPNEVNNVKYCGMEEITKTLT